MFHNVLYIYIYIYIYIYYICWMHKFWMLKSQRWDGQIHMFGCVGPNFPWWNHLVFTVKKSQAQRCQAAPSWLDVKPDAVSLAA